MKITLAEKCPELLSEWDYEKNTFLPESVSYGSAKTAWWVCSKCGFHWCTPIYSRASNGSGCPECSKKSRGQKHSILSAKKNNLFIQFPNLAKEWDYDKNNPLRPEDVSVASNKTVWWKCLKCNYSWQTSINHRTNRENGTGCPKCALIKRGRTRVKIFAKANNFAKNYPDIAHEWDYEKNDPLRPDDISPGCNDIVWWKCSFCGYSWKASVNHRTGRKDGCPNCSKAQTSTAEQCVFYYVKLAFPEAVNRYFDQFEFDVYIPTLKTAIEYDGKVYHQSKKVIERDALKDEFCKNNSIRLIRFREKSMPDTPFSERITCSSKDLTKGIEELLEKLKVSPIPKIDLDRDRIKILSSFRQEVQKKSVAVLLPDLVKEWDLEKNEGIKPESVFANSNVKYWWKCSKCSYQWLSTPNHRYAGRGCPCCSSKVIVEGVNDLASNNPELAKEWDYEKNYPLLPTQVTKKSPKKRWWKCRICGYVWQARVSDRNREERSTGCPKCFEKNRKAKGPVD